MGVVVAMNSAAMVSATGTLHREAGTNGGTFDLVVMVMVADGAGGGAGIIVVVLVVVGEMRVVVVDMEMVMVCMEAGERELR